MHQIGVGGLGPVFRAYDPSEDRLVAVKAFHLDMTPEQARTLAQALEHLVDVGLSHPGLVTPLAAGLEDGLPYLAQEYVAAESLDVAMRHYSPAQGETAMLFISQMADVIDAAHESGIVHGALHLRDVMVTPEEAHLTGFGVVTALEEIGLAGPIRRPYTAPEVITRRPWGGAADRFALASIAYELITGRRAAGTGAQVTERLRSVAGATDPEQLQDVFAMALADDPDDRYSSSARFVAAMSAAMGDVSTDAGPASPVATDETTEMEPLDLLAGLDLHPAESPVSPVDAVLDELVSREGSFGSTGGDATSSERLSFEAPDVPQDDPLRFEDNVLLARSAVPGSESGIEIDRIETRPKAGSEEASDADFQTDDGAADDIGDAVFADDDVDEVDPAGEIEDAWVDLPGPDDSSKPPNVLADTGHQPFGTGRTNEDVEAQRAKEDDDGEREEEGVAGSLFDGHLPIVLSQSRTWWRRPGGVTALVLAVGLLAYAVVAGLVTNDAPTDLVLGVTKDAAPDTASREFSETVVDAESTAPVLGAAGGAPSTAAGAASGDGDTGDGAAGSSGAVSAPPTRPGENASDSSVASPSPPPAVLSSSSSPATARLPGPAGEPGTAPGDDPVISADLEALSRPAEITGWILVRTEPPAATVLLDGVRRGQTPLSLRNVPYGQHQVEVSRPGFETVRHVVTVGALTAVLPVGIELVPTDQRAETERTGAPTGSLVFRSRPAGALVFVDGSPAGRTPIVVEVAPGRHDVRIEGDGYAEWVTTVEVTAVERVPVNASLERLSR